jgi:hypothetical protein
LQLLEMARAASRSFLRCCLKFRISTTMSEARRGYLPRLPDRKSIKEARSWRTVRGFLVLSCSWTLSLLTHEQSRLHLRRLKTSTKITMHTKHSAKVRSTSIPSA